MVLWEFIHVKWRGIMARIGGRLKRKSRFRMLSVLLIVSLVFSLVSPAYATSPSLGASKEQAQILTNVLNQLQSQVPLAEGVEPFQWSRIDQVNLTSSGATPFGGWSFNPSISGDGRYVVFESDSGLIEGRNYIQFEAYVHDRLKGTTELISEALDNSIANGRSGNVSISADGNFVAFESDASNLVENDNNNMGDIFVRDLRSQVTERVSVSSTGVEADNAVLNASPSISGDGRYVVFNSLATNLIDGKPVESFNPYMYIRDRLTNTTIRVTNQITGEPVEGYNPKISENGKYLVFESSSMDLVPDDSNFLNDVFVYTLETGLTERVSLTSLGEEADGMSYSPTISADGQMIAFVSTARNLTYGSFIGNIDRLFLHNRLTGQTEHITVGLGEVEPDDHSSRPMVSGDGRYVIFQSSANNLVDGDFADPNRTFGDQNDVFVYDSVTKHTERVVFPMDGQELNGASSFPAISSNGKVVTFQSKANTLVPHDSSPFSDDIFVSFDKKDVPVWPVDRAISLTDISQNSVTLNWPLLENQGVLGYRIYQDDRKIGFVEAAVHSFKVDGLDPTKQYRFKIEAVNQSYNSSQNGPTLTTATEDKQAPVWPIDTKLNLDSVSPTTVTFSWTPAQDNIRVNHYEVYEVLDEQTHSVRALAATPMTFIHLTDLTPDKEYKIVVRARDEAGNWSEFSPLFTVKTLKEDAGTIESALFVDALPGGKADLRWVADENADVQTYEIWRGKGSENLTLITSTESFQTTYQDNGLLAETEYTYQVIGKDETGHETYRTKLVKFTTAVLSVSSFKWLVNSIKGYALQNGTLTLTLKGDPNYTGEALLTCKTVDDENIALEQRIILTEKSSGTYEGSYQLPTGVTELTSLVATLSDSAGHVITKKAENWEQPIKTTGSLSVDLTFNGEIGNYLEGAQLVAWSESKRSGSSVKVTDQTSYRMNQLIPAEDYTVRLLLANGKMLDDVTNVKVLSGRTELATLAMELPAVLQLVVKNPSGEAIPEVEWTLMDENDRFIRNLTTDASGRTTKVEGFVATQKLKAQIRLYDQPYYSSSHDITLGSFDNVKEIILTPFTKGKLQGQVTDMDGKPLAHISIFGSQIVDERNFYFKTTTDADGKYSLDLYEGMVDLQFTSQDQKILGLYGQQIVIKGNETNTLQTQLETMGEGEVDLKVYTKFIGQNWEGPFNVEQLFKENYQIHVRNKLRYVWGDEPLPPSVRVQGFIGDVIEVCVAHPFLGTACEEATIDENRNASVTVNLEERGGRIEGNVVNSATGKAIGNWSGMLYKYNPDQKNWYQSQGVYPTGIKLSTNVWEAGQYKLEIEHTDSANVKSFAQTEFTVRNGEIKQLNNIILHAEGVFSGQPGNYFTSIPSVTSPGRLVTLYGSFQHKQDQPYEEVTLLIEIPNGTTFREGSVMVNGKAPAEGQIFYNADQNRYEVTLDEVKPNEESTVRYQIQLNKDLTEAEIGATLRLRFNDQTHFSKEEIIGSAFVRTPQITLNAMENVSTDKNLPVSGRAPADSEVLVYAGSALLGKTEAISTGVWSMKLDLPDLGSPRQYKLRAETVIDETTYRSKVVNVFYDKERPNIVSLTLVQANGKKVDIDPSKGVARFPFVVNPKLPIQFEIRFTDPIKVENVELHMGESFELATLENGVYKGSMPIQGRIGDIFVTYDTVKVPKKMEPIETKEQLEFALEEFQQNLPNEVKDNKAENITFTEEAGIFKTSMDITSPNTDADLKLNMSYEPGISYTPTEEDLAFSQAYGVEIYDLSYDLVEENGEYRVKLSALFPETAQASAFIEKMTPANRSAVNGFTSNLAANATAAAAAGTVTKIVIDYAMKGTDLTLKGVDAYGAGASFGSLAENIARIEVLLEQLAQCPSGPVADFLKGTLDQAMAYEVIKWSTAIASAGIGAAATLGTGGIAFPVGVALFAAGQMIGNGLDASMAKRMQLAEDLVTKQLQRCEDPDGGGSSTSGGKKKPKNGPGGGGPVASPVYIYDPSGYVYEAIESNRLEGVTATVLTKNPLTNLWEKWDAEWFEQINPQETDPNGRYGWDVPEGYWQVVYEKEGYESTKSAELKVQPPHFDVNIGMVSYAPPQVESLRAVSVADGEDYVEVTLSKFIDVDSLIDSTIAVQSPTGVLTGVVTAFQKEQEAIIKKLTRVIRFVPTGDLVVGDTYSVSVNASTIFSYSGVGMENNFIKTVVAEAQDVTAPALISTSVDPSGTLIRLTFDQSLDGTQSLNLNGFTLEGTMAVPKVVSFDAFDHSLTKIIMNLAGSIQSDEHVTVGIAAGTVSDQVGNGNAPIRKTITNQVLSTKAELSNLMFTQGKLSPSFNAKTKEYTLTVGKGLTQIELHASLADAKAQIMVDGLPLKSGMSRIFALTEDETLITLFIRAEDKKTVDSYTVKVVRSDVVQEEPNTPTIPVPSGPVVAEAIINGVQADITHWFHQKLFVNEKDEKSLRVDFNNDAFELLSKLSTVKQAIVDLTKTQDDISFFISAQAMQRLIEKEIPLVVKTGKANVMVLPDADELKSLMKKLDVNEKEIMLRMMISHQGSAIPTSFTAFSEKVHISFELVVGMKVVPLELLKGNGLQVEMLLKQEIALKDSHKLGVYVYDAENAKWKYIRSKNEAAVKGKMTFVAVASGVYQIMEYQKSFADIQKHWAKEDIELLASKHVVIGSNDNYIPNAKITRIQLAAMLLRSLGLNEYKGSESSFQDVKPGHWAFGIAEAVTRAGFINVSEAGMFKPNEFITREEMVITLIRAIESETGEIRLSKSEQQKILNTYKDQSQLNEMAKESFAKAIHLQIIIGVHNQLLPQDTSTRAQAAVTIRRLMQGLGIL
jgi:large repetitive protein